jgi:hypothetical protein
MVAEKLDWKGLKIKKSVGNRKIIIGSERINNSPYFGRSVKQMPPQLEKHSYNFSNNIVVVGWRG